MTGGKDPSLNMSGTTLAAGNWHVCRCILLSSFISCAKNDSSDCKTATRYLLDSHRNALAAV